MKNMNGKMIAIVLMVLSPFGLLAHGSHGSGFVAGLSHPILGLDHLLALLAIGALAYFKKTYIKPTLSFIIPMMAGGFYGMNQAAVTLVESGITLSVILIGLMLILHKHLPEWIMLTLLVLFGLMHGYAHGFEMPEDTTWTQYIPGYMLGAALLISAGYLIGSLFTKVIRKKS